MPGSPRQVWRAERRLRVGSASSAAATPRRSAHHGERARHRQADNVALWQASGN